MYGCLLDCTKAFDTIEHSQLLEKLAKVVIIQIYVCIYRRQTVNVLWNGHYSREFSIRNGVRQGAVISPLFFSFYMNILRNSGSGCYVDGSYAG